MMKVFIKYPTEIGWWTLDTKSRTYLSANVFFVSIPTMILYLFLKIQIFCIKSFLCLFGKKDQKEN